MTPTLVVLIGPAGCGKTAVGRALASALSVPFKDGDDLHSDASIERMRRGLPLGDAEREPWLDRVHEALVTSAQLGEGLVVACSALKLRYRDRLAKGLPDVRFLQLDADAATLRRRLAERQGHFFSGTLLDSQLAALEPLPEAARVDATLPLEHVVAAAQALLRRS